MGCSHLPREREFIGQREQEEPVSNIQLGNSVPFHLQNARPRAVPDYSCMGIQEGKSWMLVLPLGSCEKGETSQRSPVCLLPLLAWTVSLPPQALPGVWLREGALWLQHSFSFLSSLWV